MFLNLSQQESIEMPISKYFKGHGEEVMANMKKQYGEEKGERVFYATANKRKGNKPRSKMRTAMGQVMHKKGGRR
jgi:hypothetical protein